VWIPGRARVLASGLCVKRRVLSRCARAEDHGCSPDFCRNNYAELMRVRHCSTVHNACPAYTTFDQSSHLVLVSHQLLVAHALSNVECWLSWRLFASFVGSVPSLMHAGEHKQTRSRLVRIPYRWAYKSRAGDRSRLPRFKVLMCLRVNGVCSLVRFVPDLRGKHGFV
jgi:hypothetical protein